jgi:hypothetical protein
MLVRETGVPGMKMSSAILAAFVAASVAATLHAQVATLQAQAGFYCRIDFRPADADNHRQFLRVEEGAYQSGVFKFLRIWNGDETGWGLNFGAEPLVLRVSVATYQRAFFQQP